MPARRFDEAHGETQWTQEAIWQALFVSLVAAKPTLRPLNCCATLHTMGLTGVAASSRTLEAPDQLKQRRRNK